MSKREGHPLQLAALYRAHAQQVARWAQRMGGPDLTGDVDDIVQEVFITVDRLLAGFRGDASLSTWIFEITSRIVLRHRRKLKLRRWLASVVGSSTPPAAPSLGPDQHIEERQALARAYRILDAMAEKYRRVFILYELEGLSGQAIAELTDQKLSTVWVHLHRARHLFDERVARAERIEQDRLEKALPARRLPGSTR